MLYMVNPSETPKRKKSRRKNPELLIVNPYSLGGRKEKTMARTKRRRRRRRNPAQIVAKLRKSVEGVVNVGSLKQAAWIGAGGAVALGLVTKLPVLGDAVAKLGALLPTIDLPLVGPVSFGPPAVAVLSAATVAAIAGLVATFADPAGIVTKLGTAGAQGALIVGMATLLAPLTSKALGIVPGAGFGSFVTMPLGANRWTKNADGSGGGFQAYEPAGRWVANAGEDFVKLHDVVPTITPKELSRARKGSFGGYERLGDIYGSQRLGSFEKEGNLGGYVDESTSYGIVAQGNQQIADTAALNADLHMTDETGGTIGSYGAYEAFGAPGQGGGAGDFSPLWS